LLGRLFGTTRDNWNKKELLLAITPHIIRNIPTGEADLVEMWSGTDAKLRFGAPNLKASGGSGVLGVAPAGATPAATATPTPTAAPTPNQIPGPRGSPMQRPVLAPVTPAAPAEAPHAPDAEEPAAKTAPGATQ
jgi:general secretion pathway protein D